MRSTSRRAVSRSWFTLLASPDSARGGLGRARSVSLGPCCTRVFPRVSCLYRLGIYTCFSALCASPSTSSYEMLRVLLLPCCLLLLLMLFTIVPPPDMFFLYTANLTLHHERTYGYTPFMRPLTYISGPLRACAEPQVGTSPPR